MPGQRIFRSRPSLSSPSPHFTALAVVSLIFPGPSAAPAQEMKVESGHAQVDGGTLYYEVAGDGMPLVLIHGGAMDRRMWDDQFMEFARQYRVVRYDVRGFGESPAPTARFMPSEDLVTLLDALSVERAHVLGLSMGGGLAIDFALAHPERVAGLVLAEPGVAGWQFSAEVMGTMGGVFAAMQRGEMEEAQQLFLDSPALRSAKTNPDAYAKIERLVRENFGGIRSQVMMGFAELRAIDVLARIESPTLILVSERAEGDALGIAERLESDIPHNERAEIAGAGHMMNIEQPERFNTAVMDFLSRIRGR